MYDVIVVGAGPAGSAAAHDCSESGLDTLCIEEHGTVGYPVQCAGLLSNAAFDECGVSQRPVLNTVSGARIVSGHGSELFFDAQRTKAVVVDRCMLDREMAERAADCGAQFRLKTSVYGVHGTSVLTRGINGHEEFSGKLLIAADGPRNTIARLLNMERQKHFLAGIQADLPHECDPRIVQIYPDASPDFFGWMIPSGKDRVRVGLCTKTQAPERFAAFVKRFGTGSTHLVTGTLPLGLMPRTYGHRTLFVGDAAGFPKPTSGGGVYTGIRSARHAAAVAADACEQGRYDDTVLAGYEERWKADIGRELDLGFRLYAMRQNMSPDDIDRILKALSDPGIIDTIVQHGDMDRPGKLVRKLLKKPGLLALVRPLLKSGIRSFLG